MPSARVKPDRIAATGARPLLGRRTQAMHAFLAEQAAQGTQPWARL